MVVNSLVWVLGTELGSLQEQYTLLAITSELSLQQELIVTKKKERKKDFRRGRGLERWLSG